jgi:TRAP-type transport system periplasmic protein
MTAGESLTVEQQATATAAAVTAADAGRAAQLAKEDELVAFLEGRGLEINEPDVAAFRSAVQSAYLSSGFASSWPEGVLDAINALGN